MSEKTNIEKFEQALSAVKREGMDKLLEYIRRSDFYRAPASTKYHSCHESGLLEHSLNVMGCLLEKMNQPIWKDILAEVGNESLVLSALLHDICKSNFYTVELKNKKVYNEHGKKIDANGRFDWETVPGYIIEDKIHPFGHGECSVIMLQQFIKLKPAELYMIRFHMLFSEPKELYNTLSWAIKKCPAIIAMNQADLEATYLMEKEE